MCRPTEHDARVLVQHLLQCSVHTIRRFPTGGFHYVYEVVTDAAPVVVRIAHTASYRALCGGVYWNDILRAKGISMPALLAADLAATIVPFGSMIVERVPGTDLGYVYNRLTYAEKAALAAAVVDVQARVATLPPRDGFGYATDAQTPLPYRRWIDVVLDSLAQSRQRIAQRKIVDLRSIDAVYHQAVQSETALAQMRPTAFLDDITTKNVIVDKGQLSGIVDTDFVCYGDPLWTIALTHMALLKSGEDSDYITCWTDLLHLSLEQRRLLRLYLTVFCVDFLGEVGHASGNGNAIPGDAETLHRLTTILDSLLSGKALDAV